MHRHHVAAASKGRLPTRRTWLLAALALGVAGAAPRGAAAPSLPCSGNETLCGDGGPAVDARLLRPLAVAARPDGGFLVADAGNDAIRAVSADGVITTVAGLGVRGYGGDGGPAIAAQLDTPNDVSPRPGGGFFVADTGNAVIRRILGNGTISTVAGNGTAAPTTTPADATAVALKEPRGVAALAAGGYLVADTGANLVLRVSADGKARVVAGTGVAGHTGDGAAAVRATLDAPTRVLPEDGGGFLVLDSGNGVVRRVAPDGRISTVAGTQASLDHDLFGQLTVNPGGLAEDDAGNLFILDDRQVLVVSPAGGQTVIAGTGDCGSNGDGGPAEAAAFATPSGLALSDDGLLVVDYNNQGDAAGNVRLVAGDGKISSVAGKAHTRGCVGAGGSPSGALWPIFYITAPRDARALRPVAIKFATTIAARVQTSLLQGSRRVRTVTRPGKLGLNTVTLTGVPRGSYTMEIKSTATVDNNIADASPAKLVLTKRFAAPLTVRR